MTAIALESVRKSFGPVTALEDVSISIERGELYGLLGPNGAGKTTTIAIVAGQLVPDGGRVRVLGLDPVERPVAVRERLGILPERESPPSYLTPREYLRFVGDVRGRDPAETDAAIRTWADRLTFHDHLETFATDLSRGQQQKVMIAGAFLHEPPLVVIDEPVANLDPIMQERIKQFLRTYRADGHTVVLSTHNIGLAADICTRIGILSDGALLDEVRPDATASTAELLDMYLEMVDSPAHAEDTGRVG